MRSAYIILFLLTQHIVDKYQKNKKRLDIYTNYFVYSDINNKGNIMNIEEIIELLESIDQNINYGNLDEAQVDIAINLRTLYKQLVKK